MPPIGRTVTTGDLTHGEVTRQRFGGGGTAALIELATPFLALDDKGLLAPVAQGPPTIPAKLLPQLSPNEAVALQGLLVAGDSWARFLRGQPPAPRRSGTAHRLSYTPPRGSAAVRAGLTLSQLKVAGGVRNALVCSNLLKAAQADAAAAVSAGEQGHAAWTAACQFAQAATAQKPKPASVQDDLTAAQQELANANAAIAALQQLQTSTDAAKQAAAAAQAAYVTATSLQCGEAAAIYTAAATAQEAATELENLSTSFGLALVAMGAQGALDDASQRIASDTNFLNQLAQQQAQAQQDAVSQAQAVAPCIQFSGEWYGCSFDLSESCTRSFDSWLVSTMSSQISIGNIATKVASLFTTTWWTVPLWAALLLDGWLLHEVIDDCDQGSGVTIHFSVVAGITNAMITANPAFALTAVTGDLGIEAAAGGYDPSGLTGWIEEGALIASNVAWLTTN